MAEISIRDLPAIYADFKPVADGKTNGQQESLGWNAAASLAWALRLADNQGDQEMTEKIKTNIEKNPAFKYYVVYALLSDSYEEEKSFESDGFGFNPISKDLKNYAITTLEKRLTETKDPKELQMFKNIASRVRYYGSIYIDANDTLKLFDIIKSRESAGDGFLKDGEGKSIFDAIEGTTSRIKQ